VLTEVRNSAAKAKKISRRHLEQAKKTLGVKYRRPGRVEGPWECYLGAETVDEGDPTITPPGGATLPVTPQKAEATPLRTLGVFP